MRHEIKDDLFWYVLFALALSNNMRLRWRELCAVVHKKYDKVYDRATFKVLLYRVLLRLSQLGYVKKDIKGHQEVYYFIPKAKQKEIVDELNKRAIHKKIDASWEKLSSEQRKKLVADTLGNQQILINLQNNFTKGLLKEIREIVDYNLSKIDNRPEPVRKELSFEEKRKMWAQLGNEVSKFESILSKEEEFAKKNSEEFKELQQDYINKVVDPLYGGNSLAALMDLMRKAIAEQDAKVQKEKSVTNEI